MKTELIKEGIEKGISYEKYLESAEQIIGGEGVWGLYEKESMLNYTKLNLHRMKRIDKTVKVNESLSQLVQQIDKKLYFLIISEAWCGDAAHNVPIINKLAALNPNIEVKIVWRDKHPALMDQYLTNGGKSIPKLIIIEAEGLKELAVWGPRPAPAQAMVMDYRKQSEPEEPYSEFVKKVQLWYAKDKYQTVQNELEALLREAVVPALV